MAWSWRAMLELREVICGWRGCGRALYLCSGCDRGRRYCSAGCRDAARRRSQRRARRKYARSDRGRRNNRERQRRWRARQASKIRNGSVFTGEEPCVEVVPCTGLANGPGEAGGCGDIAAWPRRELATRASALAPRSTSGPHRVRAEDGAIRRCDVCGCIGRVVRRSAKRGRFRWRGNTSHCL